jgi:hypothetical protein
MIGGGNARNGREIIREADIRPALLFRQDCAHMFG